MDNKTTSLLNFLVFSQSQIEAYDDLRGTQAFDPKLQFLLFTAHKELEKHTKKHLKKCYEMEADTFVVLTDYFEKSAKLVATMHPDDFGVHLDLVAAFVGTRELPQEKREELMQEVLSKMVNHD